MSATQLLLFCLLIFGANVVGALAGYGGSVLALPLLNLVLGDQKVSIATLISVGTFQSFHLAIVNRGDVDRVGLRRLLGWCYLGVPMGLITARYLPERGLLLVLGIVVVLSGLLPLAVKSLATWPLPRGGKELLLVLGGLVHGAFAAGGGLVVIGARDIVPNKDAFRATMFVFWVLFNAVVITSFVFTGRMVAGALPWACIGIPVVALANLVGQRIAGRLSQSQFQLVLSVLLVLAGAVTVWRSVG